MAGSMRERYPGAWELRVSQGFDPITGKRLMLSRSVRGTKRMAALELAKLVAEVDDGRVAPVDGSITVAALVDAFLERWTGAGSTLAGYRSIQEVHIRPTIGRHQVRKVTPRLLDDFYTYLAEEKGLSSSRVHQVHAVLRSAFTTGVRWGWLTTNPVRDAKAPTVRQKDIKIPDPATVVRLLAMADAQAPEWGTLFRLSAATGARRSELCGLRWIDVDFEAGSVRIERAVVSVGGTPIEKDTKNHSQRTVSLDEATMASLEAMRRAKTAQAVTHGMVLRPSGFLFSNELDGSRPLHPDLVSDRWESVCRKAGVKGVRLHDLRHFQATMLLAYGVPLKNVSSRLGHRNASTTLNIYAKALESHDEGAADIIGNLLATQPAPPEGGRGARKRRRTASSGDEAVG